MGQHRTPDPPPTGGRDPRDELIANYKRILIGVNLVVAAVFATSDVGKSPGLLILTSVLPLPVWGIAGLGMVAVGLMVGLVIPAHFGAIVIWTVLAAALVLGVVSGASQSPAASLSFAALACLPVALHVAALLYRRALQRR